MPLRQKIQKQFNRIDLSNKFAHAVFFDNDQAFQDGDPEEQKLSTACQVLFQNAIVLWNYLYLSDLILRKKTGKIPTPEESALAKISSRELSAFLKTQADTQALSITDKTGVAHAIEIPVSAHVFGHD